MVINKSSGVTNTEQILAKFCEDTFLKLWSYPNPFKEDGHEICDLLAVFGDYVFIFFDRKKQLPAVSDEDPQVLWKRWKRKVVDHQIKTAHGAERYIRSGKPIFLDTKCTEPFPLAIDPQNAVVHKIIVAHGAKEACERDSEQNIYGSLAIRYGTSNGGSTPPFFIEIDKHNPVHIFDSHNLPIILSELDTVSDFSDYLDEKLRAVARLDFLVYCGEEDLLCHYLLNYDKTEKRYFIGTKNDNVNGVMIEEGEWHSFIKTDLYKNTKNENQVSYYWDRLIQRTCQNALDGRLGGNSDLLRGESAIFEMVKEPRLTRRMLADGIRQAVVNFPDHPSQLTRHITFMPSYYPKAGYVFFQLRVPDTMRREPDYLDKRRKCLVIACGAARNKFTHLTKVIGIVMDAPKFAGDMNSEDFILLPCETWTDERRVYYDEQNLEWNFFGTPQLKQYNKHVTRFVPPLKAQRDHKGSLKVGRNDPCPCGSGKKFKKCHGH